MIKWLLNGLSSLLTLWLNLFFLYLKNLYPCFTFPTYKYNAPMTSSQLIQPSIRDLVSIRGIGEYTYMYMFFSKRNYLVCNKYIIKIPIKSYEYC